VEGPLFPSRPAGGRVRLSRLARVFAWTGLTSIGGGRYAFFYDALVARRRWLSNEEFVQDLPLAQILPGPTFSNIAVALGFRLGGWRGALWGVAALVLPGALILLALSAAYFRGGLSPTLGGAMPGMSAAVVGLVFASTARVIVGSVRDWRSPLLAAAVFLLVGPLRVNTALVIAAAVPVGIWLYRPRRPRS
jgi:chromate transporter